ncbi:MAG: hypothetical protein JW894_07560 [Bacteroidales bacterium]|nr:hypothetical protein [Bacteroidales bacterium]
MKKQKLIFVAVIAVFLLSLFNIKTNAQSFEKGDVDLNLQIGFGTTWYYGSYYKASLPFISVAGDYAMRDDWGPGVFGIGGLIGVSTYKYEYYWYGYGDYGWKETHFVIAPRATYHYQFFDKLDTYAGIISGIKIVSEKAYGDWYAGYEPESNAGAHFVFSAFAGVKYYFAKNISVMSEIYVYDIALFNIGIGFKF